MKTKMLIWVDPSTNCGHMRPDMVVINCVSYDDAISKIEKYKDKYDLHLDLCANLPMKKTGYDIARYLIEKNIKCKYRVHSILNIKVRKDIEHLLDNYKYLKF